MTVREFDDEKSADPSAVEADVSTPVVTVSVTGVKQCCVCSKNGSKCYEAAMDIEVSSGQYLFRCMLQSESVISRKVFTILPSPVINALFVRLGIRMENFDEPVFCSLSARVGWLRALVANTSFVHTASSAPKRRWQQERKR